MTVSALSRAQPIETDPTLAAVPEQRARHTTRWFLMALAVLLVTQAGLNLALNPAGAFRESGLLLSSVRSSYAYQKLQALEAFLVRTQGAEITLALGSSRMILIPGPVDAAQQPYFFNAGIDGGTAEDILAFTLYVLDHPGVHVKRVYINVDTGIVGGGSEADYGVRLSGVYELERWIHDSVATRQGIQRTLDSLVTSDWLVASIEHTLTASGGTPSFNTSSGVAIEERMFAGRINSGLTREQLLEESIERNLEAAPDGPPLSEKRIADLEKAIELWHTAGAEVVLVYMPYATGLWLGLNEVPRFRERAQQMDQLLLSLATDRRTAYCDFRDPASTGITSDEYWWDGSHYTGDAARILSDEAHSCAAQQLDSVQAGT